MWKHWLMEKMEVRADGAVYMIQKDVFIMSALPMVLVIFVHVEQLKDKNPQKEQRGNDSLLSPLTMFIRGE